MSDVPVGDAVLNVAHDEELVTLRWHYGPTETDPDPGAMWCYACGGRVHCGDDMRVCIGCGAGEHDGRLP